MKYIKQFELYHEPTNVNELLKYFAYATFTQGYPQFTSSSNYDELRIYEILLINIDSNKTTLTLKVVADYDIELKNYKKTILCDEPITIQLFELKKENILYTSNDLEDIKTMIPVLLDTKNYNL